MTLNNNETGRCLKVELYFELRYTISVVGRNLSQSCRRQFREKKKSTRTTDWTGFFSLLERVRAHGHHRFRTVSFNVRVNPVSINIVKFKAKNTNRDTNIVFCSWFLIQRRSDVSASRTFQIIILLPINVSYSKRAFCRFAFHNRICVPGDCDFFDFIFVLRFFLSTNLI